MQLRIFEQQNVLGATAPPDCSVFEEQPEAGQNLPLPVCRWLAVCQRIYFKIMLLTYK